MRKHLLLVAAVILMVSGCPSDTSRKTGTTDKDRTNKEKSGKQEHPPPPCHPGCFPLGTSIVTPGGPRPIETIRSGDLVTLVDSDGNSNPAAVESIFRTSNRIIEIRTDSGSLLTTETQPLCLPGGGFRRAGELAKGDVIWRWEKSERCPARVLGVYPDKQDVNVFNLVVGESAVFIAGGFLARGKPPGDPLPSANTNLSKSE